MSWWILGIGVAVVLVWMGGDLLYSLLMRRRHARWEASLERDPDGVRLGCREFTLGSGDTALLLIHGFADSPAVYQRLAPALAAKGFTCRALRLPHFAMPLAEYRRTSSALWRQTVIAELRDLRRTHARVVVVAHSLGAAIALDSLTEQPEAAEGVVLLAPLVEVSNRRSPFLPPRVWYHLLDRTLIFTDRIGMVFGSDLKDKSAVALLKEDWFVPRVIYRELFALLKRNRQRAQVLRMPLLMVLSRNDQVIDNRAAERFFQECASTRKRLKYVEETGHVLPLDHGWEMLVEEIGKFVAELPATAAAEKAGAEEGEDVSGQR